MRRGPSLVATSVSPVTHGFDALIRPLAGVVCHLLIVVSNWMPGSAQRHAHSAMRRNSFLASSVRATLPLFLHFVSHGLPAITACMNSSVTRTLLLAFWPETV